MNIWTKKLISLILMILLAPILATPTLAEAGRGHRGHGHHHGHHHHKHHHHGSYGYVYSQPWGYYQPHYPQPRSNYYNSYYPAPVYVPAPQLMMGIGSGNVDFMIRF